MEEAEAIRRVAGALLTGGGAIGVGIGVGLITAKYLEGIARQPELQPYLFTQLLIGMGLVCLLYTSPSPRDGLLSRMPSSA